MKFIKKYGIYFVLIVATFILGGVGYISESQKDELQKKEEVTLVPEEKEELPQEFEEAEKVSAPAEVDKLPAGEEKTVFERPVRGEVINEFSGEKMVYSETMDDFRTHQGEDYALNDGEEIFAAAKGKVTDIYQDDFFGLCIEISHADGIITRYAAIGEAKVMVGDNVKNGDKIAIAGNSASGESALGVHLHFETLKDGVNIDPETLFN